MPYKDSEKRKECALKDYYLHRKERLEKNKSTRDENREKYRKMSREWNKNNPDKVKNSALKRKYGITLEEKKKLYEKQEHKCAICKKEFKIDKLQVDHEHIKKYKDLLKEEKKKYVRGLLCLICNWKILNKLVTLEKLKNAVKYLEEYELRRLKWIRL